MHETTMTIGIASKATPRNVEWKTVKVNDKDTEFQKYYKMMTTATSRQLYVLIQYFDARKSWIDNSKGKNITGLLLSASYSFSYNSNLTRTFNFEFYADGTENIYISPRNVCKFYVGLETEYDTNTIYYFGLGAGLIDGPSWNYNQSTRNVSFSAIDLGALMDGTRSGKLSYRKTWQYDQDTSVKMNIKGMIDFQVNDNDGYCIEYTDASISECVDTNGVEFLIQNDITSDAGTTSMDMLNDILNNSLPYYCYYFDSNGLFNYAIFPTADINRYVQYTIPQNLVISEQEQTPYTERYNYIEVWGLAQDISNMNISIIADEGSRGAIICDGKTYTHPSGVSVTTGINTTLSTEDETYLNCYCERLPTTQDSFEYTGDTSWGCNTIDLNDIKDLLEDNNLASTVKININAMIDIDGKETSKPLKYYEVKNTLYSEDINVLYLDRNPEETKTGGTRADYTYYFTSTGRLSPYGIAEAYDGEYGINNIGYVRNVMSEEACSSDDECLTRAKWELYKSTQVNKTIQITMIPLYFIQAGQLISYTSIRTGETDTYMISSVSCNTNIGGTMNITMTKFYTYYEE